MAQITGKRTVMRPIAQFTEKENVASPEVETQILLVLTGNLDSSPIRSFVRTGDFGRETLDEGKPSQPSARLCVTTSPAGPG